MKNLLTVRTQNSDKNPKNAFSNTEEEFGLKEDHEEGALQKLVGITAGKSTNENNNSLIMGSFENYEAKENGLNPQVQEFKDIGNDSSINGFFNIDIDHDITPIESSKNKIFTDEFTVEPSEFEHQNYPKTNQKGVMISKIGENSTKRNNMNASEFSRLSSNNQPNKTGNQNRLNLNDSFNGSSQRKPSHSYEGVETPLANDDAIETAKDKEAKFRINFEPFNENKSID